MKEPQPLEMLLMSLEQCKVEQKNLEADLQDLLRPLYDTGALVMVDNEPHRVWFSRGKFRLKSALSRSARERMKKTVDPEPVLRVKSKTKRPNT